MGRFRTAPGHSREGGNLRLLGASACQWFRRSGRALHFGDELVEVEVLLGEAAFLPLDQRGTQPFDLLIVFKRAQCRRDDFLCRPKAFISSSRAMVVCSVMGTSCCPSITRCAAWLLRPLRANRAHIDRQEPLRAGDEKAIATRPTEGHV